MFTVAIDDPFVPVVVGAYDSLAFQNSGAGVYTFTNACPALPATRLVVLAIGYRGRGRTIDRVTCRGDAVTIHSFGKIEGVDFGDKWCHAAIGSVSLINGAAGNIVVDLSGLLGINGSCHVGIFILEDASYRASFDDTGEDDASDNLSVNEGEFLVGGACSEDGQAGGISWAGLTQAHDTRADKARHGSGSFSALTTESLLISATDNDGTGMALAAAAFQSTL